MCSLYISSCIAYAHSLGYDANTIPATTLNAAVFTEGPTGNVSMIYVFYVGSLSKVQKRSVCSSRVECLVAPD